MRLNGRTVATVAISFLLIGLFGCQSQRPEATTSASDRSTNAGGGFVGSGVRTSAFALLDKLLGDEKHLSKLLIIKLETPELERVVKNISKTAGEGAALLASMSKADPLLRGATPDLPSGEHVTRESIEETRKKILMKSKGADFEFELLLTQAEALNYATHLTDVLAANEPNPGHARQLSGLAARFKELYQEVVTLLRAR